MNNENGKIISNVTIQKGYGIGTIGAMIISFTINKSIIWMFIHGLFSWLYIIYYAIFK